MEKFVYKNKKTHKYYYSADFEDTTDINKAQQYSKYSYLLFGAVRKHDSNTWIPINKFGRLDEHYTRVPFEKEMKQSRKLKLEKIKYERYSRM